MPQPDYGRAHLSAGGLLTPFIALFVGQLPLLGIPHRLAVLMVQAAETRAQRHLVSLVKGTSTGSEQSLYHILEQLAETCCAD